MPTVILLDVSLSMSRWVRGGEQKVPSQIRTLGESGIAALIDYVSTNSRYEYMSLMVFSALWEVKSQFSRDYESIKNELISAETYDKTNIVNAIQGALTLNLNEWSQLGSINIILVTDGQVFKPSDTNSTDAGSTQQSPDQDTEDVDNDIDIDSLAGSFKFPCKIQIVCLSPPDSPSLKHAIPFYKKLISVVGEHNSWADSKIWIPDELTVTSVEQLFTNIAGRFYQPFNVTISCGRMSSSAILSPKLTVGESSNTSARDITICGFVAIDDMSSPSTMSRHSVYPTYSAKHDEVDKARQVLTQEFASFDTNAISISTQQNGHGLRRPSGADEESNNQPSFCVLLHNVMKSLNMVALCQIGGPNQYGMLYAWNDNKKKSNLMLSIFRPGPDPVPWLPRMECLGIPDGHNMIEINLDETTTRDKHDQKSYSSNCVMWLEVGSLQSDVQKVIRHARRLPEKNTQFFKELNRLRRAALSYGFYAFPGALAKIIDREKVMIQAQEVPNNEAVAQLDHAAASLRRCLEVPDNYDNNIVPLTR